LLDFIIQQYISSMYIDMQLVYTLGECITIMYTLTKCMMHKYILSMYNKCTYIVIVQSYVHCDCTSVWFEHS